MQRLDCRGVDGQASGVDDSVDRQIADEVAGCTVASKRDSTQILAGYCDRISQRTSSGVCRRCLSGQLQMIRHGGGMPPMSLRESSGRDGWG